MKKILRKSLSIFLVALMLLTVAPAFVFAADEDQSTVLMPTISLEKVSETKSEVVIAVSLTENSLACLDATLEASEELTLTKIVVNVGLGESNIENGMISIASSETCTAPLTIAEYTYTKSTAEGVTADDFALTIVNCHIDSSEDGEDISASIVISNMIPAEHSHATDGEWVETKSASCSEKGEETLYCTECGEIAGTRETEKLAHKNTTDLHLDPTCEVAGYDKVYCYDCETYISETPIAATGHLDTSIDKKAPTCTEDGYVNVVCSCGHVVENTPIGASGHNYITDVKNATCEDDGYVQIICPACSDVQAKTILKSTGHSWLNWETVKKPTVSSEGIERRICKNCGTDEERSIPKVVVPAKELVISMEEITMNFKQTSRLFVNVLPEEAAYSTEIIWESSDPDVATVDEDGAVYAAGLGTATITASTADGSITATCKVTVKYTTLQWIIIYILFGWLWYI